MLRTLFAAEEVVRSQWVQPFIWELQMRIPASRFQIAHVLLVVYAMAGIATALSPIIVATLIMMVCGFAGVKVLRKLPDDDHARYVAQTHFGYQLWRLLHLGVMVVSSVVFVASFAVYSNDALNNTEYTWTMYLNGERALKALLVWFLGVCGLMHNYALICPPLPQYYRSIFK